MEDDFIKSAMDVFLPVQESAIVLAGYYADACGRDIVLAEDIRICMMYCTRNVTGKHIGSLYPEIYEDSDSDAESESWETVSDSEMVWAEYKGDDEMALKINECAHTWDAWEPQTPAERALKNAVDKQRQA